MSRFFTGCFSTTDDKKWWMGFKALSWEDAESLAEIMNLKELGECLGVFPSEPDELGNYPIQPPVSHFCSWYFKDGGFTND